MGGFGPGAADPGVSLCERGLMSPFAKGLVWVGVSYSAAFCAAFFTFEACQDCHPLWAMGAADLAATLVIFGFSVGLRNASLYDPYWSLIPLAISAHWALTGQGDPVRAVALTGLIWFWGLRLTGNWVRGWPGVGHQDWRYEDLREKSGPFYPLVNLFGIHLCPTALVFMGCLPVFFSLHDPAPMEPLEWVAVVFGVGMVVLEWVADEQLWAFRKGRTHHDTFLQTGLWAWSRHPNYCGEAFFWVSLWAVALAGGHGPYWTAAGALSMIGLFVFASIPMMKKKNLARKPGYAGYVARTSAFIPWPPKGRGEP